MLLIVTCVVIRQNIKMNGTVQKITVDSSVFTTEKVGFILPTQKLH